MCHPRSLLLIFALFAGSTAAVDFDLLTDTAERHLRQQSKGLPGRVSIAVGKPDISRLPPCSAYEAFTPPGARIMGKSTVGIRCLGPNIWSILVPATISVTGNYVTTARPLAAGQPIQPGDLSVLSGDLSQQPTGVITDPASAIGKTPRNSLGAGLPLRADQLIAPLVIRQGQSVRVVSKGEGFSVSSDGKAMTNASEGQLVQVRMNSGQTVSGMARSDGSVEISF